MNAAVSSAPASLVKPKANVPARSIALPVEHGAWGFLFEPLAAGMLVAPSAAAPFILLLVAGAFLTRQPLKFLLGDFLQKKYLPRTAVALRFALIFGGISLLGLFGSLVFAPIESFIPFIIVAPLVVYLIAQDAARQTRQLLPELLAAAALASSITALALAGGFAYPAAFALWAIMLARLIPSVLYVRSRLRLEKGKPFSRFTPVAAHILAFAFLGALYLSGFASILTLVMAAFLAGRAAFGLSRCRQILQAKQLGIWEVVYGVIYALTVVFGCYLNL